MTQHNRKARAKPTGPSAEKQPHDPYDPVIAEWALSFEKYIDKDPVARKALSRLVKAGCSKVVIIELLRGARVDAPRDVATMARTKREAKNQAQRLSRDLTSLANQLQRFHDLGIVPYIEAYPAEFSLGSDKHQGISLRLVKYLPSLLSQYAVLLEHTWATSDFLEWMDRPSIDLFLLTAYVKEYARRPCYPELCYLLDAADCHENKNEGVECWDPDALRNLTNRFRRRHAEYAQRVDQLITESRLQPAVAGLPSSEFLGWLYSQQCEIPL
jgi:hypothetical protein